MYSIENKKNGFRSWHKFILFLTIACFIMPFLIYGNNESFAEPPKKSSDETFLESRKVEASKVNIFDPKYKEKNKK